MSHPGLTKYIKKNTKYFDQGVTNRAILKVWGLCNVYRMTGYTHEKKAESLYPYIDVNIPLSDSQFVHSLAVGGRMSSLGHLKPVASGSCHFLMSRPQVVRVGNIISSMLTLNTGTPQGCLLSPFLYSMFTCGSNTIIKFANDTIVVGPDHQQR
jgi:hypothetical protein